MQHRMARDLVAFIEQRAEQQRVGNREDRAVGTDAERQRCGGDGEQLPPLLALDLEPALRV